MFVLSSFYLNLSVPLCFTIVILKSHMFYVMFFLPNFSSMLRNPFLEYLSNFNFSTLLAFFNGYPRERFASFYYEESHIVGSSGHAWFLLCILFSLPPFLHSFYRAVLDLYQNQTESTEGSNVPTTCPCMHSFLHC